MPLSILNPWVILAIILSLGAAGTGGYFKGGADNEARHVKADLAATRKVLDGFTEAAKDMNGIAGQFTAISQDLDRNIGTISRNFRNGASQHPLSPDCRPDAFRVQSLSAAIGAANTAAGRGASPAVPAAQ